MSDFQKRSAHLRVAARIGPRAQSAFGLVDSFARRASASAAATVAASVIPTTQLIEAQQEQWKEAQDPAGLADPARKSEGQSLRVNLGSKRGLSLVSYLYLERRSGQRQILSEFLAANDGLTHRLKRRYHAFLQAGTILVHTSFPVNKTGPEEPEAAEAVA